MNEMPGPCSLLFVDDDPRAGNLLHRFCEGTRYECHTYRNPVEALNHFQQSGADIVVTDLRMPEMDGLELIAKIRDLDVNVPIVIVTAYSSLDSAIEALRHGATDFLKKPFDMEELILVVDKTLERIFLHRQNRLLRRELRAERKEFGLIGKSPTLKRSYELIERVADVPCNVIIQGESGTGKELAARAIHALSDRSEAPFIAVDCGALSDTLLESELFGHEKGAFTGAASMKHGLFEEARGGTVFLDEIGNISEAMQVRLLRVLQERQITRVGGVRPIDVDVRCLVATNADLQEMVREKRFRADLYHRLNVVTVTMPPLRERSDDIPRLLQHFVSHFASEYGRNVTGFDSTSVRRLQAYDWPGNVRELKNLVERHVVLAERPVLTLEEGLESVLEPGRESPDLTADMPTLEELEWQYIQQVLEHFDGNRTKAATVLGIDKSTLWRKLQSRKH